jgi:cell pole-organizing protein PopZ
MAEPSSESDQSMEDILQSIKRIIADEGEPSPTMAGSDVLELTDLLAEDAAPPAAPEPAPTPKSAQDDIDALFNAPLPAVEPAPVPAPEPVAPIAMPAPQPAAPAPVSADKLMSESTFEASVAALKALAHRPESSSHESAVFRSGTTVEDLVIESLKPMLKNWLDGHLPDLVRSLVEREIRRVSGQ